MKQNEESQSNQERPRNPYMGIGDRCRLSEKTIRNAFSRKPITWQTARIIANALQIDMVHFRIKQDNRGRKQNAENQARPRNPYMGIGDRCRLSEKTIRNAFSRKPITWHTARIIANALQIDMGHFRIKQDNRGRKKK